MKKILFAAMAVCPLILFSCSKREMEEAQEPEEPRTMIDFWTAIDQSPYAQMLPGEESAVTAGFVQTKSSMVMNAEDNYAKIVWSAGDTFTMYAHNEGTNWKASYSTASGGEKATFDTQYQVTGTPQHSIFAPGSSEVLLGEGCEFFGLNLPTTQTAVAGKVKDDYLYSYAQSVNQGDNLSFRHMFSFVRFKMTGTAAGTVTSVTLRGARPIAGDFVLQPLTDGTPAITLSRHFKNKTCSTSITLTGTFAADTYYYFAVIPGEQDSFSLEFSDGVAKTTKIATKKVTFARGQISDIGTINLGSSLGDDVSNETITFTTATAVAPKPVTIAVLPDGFTQAEMPKYEMLARSAMNTLFNVEPFKSYKEYFNVYIMKVASNESGANITDGTGYITTARDCYFGSKWGENSYSDMEASYDKIRTFLSGHCPDIQNGTHSVDEVPVLLIINDTRYGGRCTSYSTGWGYCMAPYTYEGGRLAWSYPSLEAASESDASAGTVETSAARYAEVGSSVGNWLNTMIHEFGGHCFGRLSDEYWYNESKAAVSYIETYRWDSMYSGGVSYGLNISATYTNPGNDDPGKGKAYIKEGWQHLLDKKETLKADNPLYDRIGVYQGADVSIFNRWRSERVSCMIDNRPYFSTFQRELIVKRIMTLSGSSFNEADFWAKDVPIDPVRDVVGGLVMGDEDPIPPRPVPLLPPPILVENVNL